MSIRPTLATRFHPLSSWSPSPRELQARRLRNTHPHPTPHSPKTSGLASVAFSQHRSSSTHRPGPLQEYRNPSPRISGRVIPLPPRAERPSGKRRARRVPLTTRTHLRRGGSRLALRVPRAGRPTKHATRSPHRHLQRSAPGDRQGRGVSTAARLALGSLVRSPEEGRERRAPPLGPRCDPGRFDQEVRASAPSSL